MSLLDKLFGGLFDSVEEEKKQIEHPCANCPSSCTIAPQACQVCKPFKAQMIDAIYRVEHKEEIISQYVVTGTSSQEGTVVCPNCGGHSENHYVCEYCGSKLQDGIGKIQVASAADIPNPVLEAQDIIFQRYDAVRSFAGADSGYGMEDALSGISSKGLFSSIFDALLGADNDSSSDSKSIGMKMTESEIEEMAKYYGVSVSDYLTGLDNGKYLTLSNKAAAARAEEKYAQSSSSGSQGGSLLGDIAGMAGVMGLGSMLFGGSTYNKTAARDPYKKPQQSKPQAGASVQADPRLKNPGAGSDLRASQIKKEAEEKARREALAKKEAEEKARKVELERLEAKRRKEAQAASGNDRLDAGNLRGSGRRDPAPVRTAPAKTDDKVATKPQSLKSFTEQAKKKDSGDKVQGNAAGMGRRPGRP